MAGRILPLRAYYFASFAALGAYAPYFPRWLEARGVEGLSMGVVAGLLPAMGVLGPPAIGIAADVLGLRGSILRVACAGACLAMAALAGGAAFGATGAAGGAAHQGLSFAAIFGAVAVFAVFRSPMVMLADVVALERVRAAGTTYGAVRLWGSLGFLFSALAVGRALDPRAGVPLPAVISTLLFLSLLAALPLPAQPAGARLPAGREARALLAAPSFALFLAVSVLAQVAHASYDLCFSLHLRDLGARDGTTGVGWAVGVVFEVALMWFADALVVRFSAPRLLAAALLGASVRWALLATVRSLPVLLVIQPLHAVSFGLWWVASIAYVRERAPANALATAQGLYSASTGLGSVLGMLVWGAVYRHAGGGAVFGTASAVALVAASLATFWARRGPWSR